MFEFEKMFGTDGLGGKSERQLEDIFRALKALDGGLWKNTRVEKTSTSCCGGSKSGCCAKKSDKREVPLEKNVEKNQSPAFKTVTNRSKYADSESQIAAFDKKCMAEGKPSNVADFVKWLDEDWTPPKEECGGFSIGDMVFAINDYSLPYEITGFKTTSTSKDVYASLKRRGDANERYVMVWYLEKACKRPWTKEEAVEAVRRGAVIQSSSSSEETVEKLFRVKRGKDGKIYVNGISVNELANGYVDYDTKHPCCGYDTSPAKKI